VTAKGRTVVSTCVPALRSTIRRKELVRRGHRSDHASFRPRGERGGGCRDHAIAEGSRALRPRPKAQAGRAFVGTTDTQTAPTGALPTWRRQARRPGQISGCRLAQVHVAPRKLARSRWRSPEAPRAKRRVASRRANVGVKLHDSVLLPDGDQTQQNPSSDASTVNPLWQVDGHEEGHGSNLIGSREVTPDEYETTSVRGERRPRERRAGDLVHQSLLRQRAAAAGPLCL
jgi:hypothetical protein